MEETEAVENMAQMRFLTPEPPLGVLREYQVRAFEWICALHEMRLGGILADEMGLGKTVETIAAILQYVRSAGERMPSLIVTPTTLTYNWESELKKFAPELRTVLIHGGQNARREIISEKIRKQAEFLTEVGKTKEADLLKSYIGQVELMDSTNREGHAAKVYFNALFGMSFTRSAETPVNAALNYGYSLILSSFNREISANGYLTQLGIFHDNMFNHFNLGSDLMEPFRVIVDRAVVTMKPEEFSKDEKHILWNLLDDTVIIESKKQSVRNAIKIYTRSVFDAIGDGDISLLKFYSQSNGTGL